MRELVLGGARSGKSDYAEQQARDSGRAVIYIATAEPLDGEMEERIALHRSRRPPAWGLVEEPRELARVLSEQASGDRCLIVDCLTLWLSNHLAAPQVDEAAFQRERQALLDVIPALPGALYLIGTEVGQGIVPMHPLSRRFVDEAGWLHQALAARCERVVWVTAGLPQLLKTS